MQIPKEQVLELLRSRIERRFRPDSPGSER